MAAWLPSRPAITAKFAYSQNQMLLFQGRAPVGASFRFRFLVPPLLPFAPWQLQRQIAQGTAFSL
jgi:hypothetical protein